MTLSVHLIQMKQMVGLGVHDTHFLYYLRRVFSYTTSDHSTHMRKFIEKKSHTPRYLVKISHKKYRVAKSNVTHKPDTTNPFINRSWVEPK